LADPIDKNLIIKPQKEDSSEPAIELVSEEEIITCPNCGSSNIIVDGNTLLCRNETCGYSEQIYRTGRTISMPTRRLPALDSDGIETLRTYFISRAQDTGDLGY